MRNLVFKQRRGEKMHSQRKKLGMLAWSQDLWQWKDAPIPVFLHNHKMSEVGRDHWGSFRCCSGSVPWSMLLRIVSRGALNISREGVSTTFLGNPTDYKRLLTACFIKYLMGKRCPKRVEKQQKREFNC